MKPGIIQRIGETHAKLFTWVSNKAKTSKMWAIILTILVVYELVEAFGISVVGSTIGLPRNQLIALGL